MIVRIGQRVMVKSSVLSPRAFTVRMGAIDVWSHRE